MSRYALRLESVRRHRLAIATGTSVALAVVAALVFVVRVADSPSGFQLFLGRLHPLIVHLPIGFVLLSVVLEGLSRIRRFVRVRHAVAPALVLSAVSALCAVVAGYLLASGGGFSGELVTWHRRFGLAVAVGTMLAAALHYAASVRRTPLLRVAYTTSLIGTVVIVATTGHLGGTLTRGPEYLTEYMPAPMLAVIGMLAREGTNPRPSFTYPDDAVIYQHLVEPVLRERCVSCHGPDQQRGDLRLHSPEAILAGGTSGPVLAPGRAGESRLIQRIWLPHDHEDIMPPRGRLPLTVVQAELLRWWIDQGASFDQTLANSAPPPGVQAMVEQIAGRPEERVAPVLRTQVPAPDSASIRHARSLGVSLRPIAQGSNFLRADCVSDPGMCGAEQVQALLPLAVQIAVLDLSGTSVVDADLEAVGRLRHLTRLHLDRTAIGDEGITHLDSLRNLEYLNLYDTSVTDAGLAKLEPLTSLRSLYLWRTSATPEGVERLTTRLPRLKVSLGTEQTTVDSLPAAAPKEGDASPF